MIKPLLTIAAGALWIITAAGGALAQDDTSGQFKDINQIIRSLAPIKYLPEHGGKPDRPSIDLDIRFAVNKASLLPSARTQLQALGQALGTAKLRDRKIEIAGHTDASGPADHNKALSIRRARMVADYLQREFQIDRNRLSVAGHGEERLKDPLDATGAVNRRVEISVMDPVYETATVKSSANKLMATAASSIADEEGAWGDLLQDRAGGRELLRRAENQGQVRVIVALSAPKRDAAQAGGWRNLNDYIRDLQDQAISELGWVNINDLVRYDFTPAMAMSVDAGRLSQLLQGDAVAQVFIDHLLTPSLSQSVPLIGLQRPRKRSNSGAGQAVAIIDSGVDSQHPFLKGRVVAEACFSSIRKRGKMVIRSACPSGQRHEVGPGAARPCGSAYGCGHGTHVAGIAAGLNGAMSGVASQAGIVAVQVTSLIDAPQCGKCAMPFTSDILRGIEWVYRNRERYNIASVNLSLGGGRFRDACNESSPFSLLFELLTRSNVAPVVASGNNGFTDAMADPACVSDAISVGATTLRDNVAKFSNGSRFLDFLAPGATERAMGGAAEPARGILSATPGAAFVRKQGTSMSAPHVAGAYAVLKGAVPNATLQQMTEALRRTGRMVRDHRNGISVPRIQLDAAVAALQGMAVGKTAKPRLEPKPKPNREAVSRSKPKPRPVREPKPAQKRKKESYDGIRVIDGDSSGEDNGEAKPEDQGTGEKRIKW
ncbi:MAG: S8 family serine peptidase [Rhodospirillaceae bacterium]|nr:S8 family serine peptidase [Rhodospirillaceae bacterium]MBT5194801.1 S8 family serine peptidase [Rhodospirillaceae bacterium]MBT5898699.1 S8 family serine peptidase [Rhodospirillaceae bacterium]MBT6430103.1 S8 family serine peptidase [Rhodospirillaceae bacterium]MBT7758587.1 S8 family serine peptidase [Rhodospirillaceae bacterium]